MYNNNVNITPKVIKGIAWGVATYSGRSPFTFSGDIRSLSRWFDGAKLILFS